MHNNVIYHSGPASMYTERVLTAPSTPVVPLLLAWIAIVILWLQPNDVQSYCMDT